MSQVCDKASGHCVACLSDMDCAGSAPAIYCYVDGGNTCAQCFGPDQCLPDAGQLGCNSHGNYCGSCVQSSDCPPTTAPLCDPQSGLCVASCVLSDGGTDCDAGVCQTSTGFCVGCLSDSDCSGGAGNPFCGTDFDAGNYCFQCRNAGDCPMSTPGCASTGHFCGACAVSSDCPSSPSSLAYCQSFACGPSCVLPDGGVSCSSGLCKTSTGVCVNCLSDSDCTGTGGLTPYCLSDIDAGNRCVGCVENSQCAPWPCDSVYNFCGYCGVDSDCPAGAPHCAGGPIGNCVDAG
jgi:hypothetical protein